MCIFFFFFLDSLSVANDIDRVFSRPSGNSFRQFNHHRLQSAPQHEQKSSKGKQLINNSTIVIINNMYFKLSN